MRQAAEACVRGDSGPEMTAAPWGRDRTSGAQLGGAGGVA